MDECTNQLELLFHASGEVTGPAVDKGAHVAEIKQFFNATPSAFAAHAIEVGIERYIFADSEVLVQAKFLTHIGEMVFNGCVPHLTYQNRQFGQNQSRHP